MTRKADSRTTSESRPQTWSKLGLLVVFALALAIRAIHLVDISARDPFYASPVVDAALHDAWAKQIIGEEETRHPPISKAEAFHKPPLYPYLLAAMYEIAGVRYDLVRGLQLLLGAVTCVLIAVLGGRLFGGATGVTAGVIAAFYGPMIHLESRLLATGLAVFLSVLVMLSVLWAQRVGKAGAWLLAGLVLSLAALTRPPLLVPGLVVAGWALYRLWREGRGRRLLRLGGVYLVGVVLFIIPVTARNWTVGHELVPICANAGINLFTGNRRGANGYSAVLPGARWEKLQQTARDAGVTKPGAASRFWTWRALREIALMPLGELVSLWLRKLAAFFAEWEIRNNVSYEFSRGASRVLLPSRLCFGLVGPLALTGLFVAWRTRRDVSAPVLFLASYLLALMPFFVCGRYRAPVMPVFIVLAAFAAVWIARQLSQRQLRQVAGTLVVTMAAGVLVHADLTGARAADDRARDYYLLGHSYLFADDINAAREAYNNALRLDQSDPDVHFALATTFEARGDLQRAEQGYQRAVRLEPTFFDAQNNLGVVLTKQGRYEEARQWLQKAIRTVPVSSRAWTNMGICQAHRKDLKAALAAARKASALDPNNLQAWLLQADVLVGDEATLNEAEAAALQAKAIDPDWPGVAMAFGRVYLAQDQPNKAIRELLPAVRRAPGSPALRIQLGMAFEKSGDKPTALKLYEQIVTALPGTPYAKLAQSRIERCRSE